MLCAQQLQPGVIDNEYITAVTAHSTYFFQLDIIDFLIDITVVEEVIDLTGDNTEETWEKVAASKDDGS